MKNGKRDFDHWLIEHANEIGLDAIYEGIHVWSMYYNDYEVYTLYPNGEYYPWSVLDTDEGEEIKEGDEYNLYYKDGDEYKLIPIAD